MAQEFTCVVNRVGPSNVQNPIRLPKLTLPVVVLTLTDLGGAFDHGIYYADDVCKDEILAVALAAISTQSQVLANLDVYVPTKFKNLGTILYCHELFIVDS